MKAEDLDRKFDTGEDLTDHLDLARARRRNAASQRDRSKPDDDSGTNGGQ